MMCSRIQAAATQERGENKGHPLMPLLFSLGQHRGLCAVAERLGPREHLVAFLNDVYVATSSPTTTVDAHNILGEEMWRHAKITLHHGKTVIWNKSGRAPEGDANGTASPPNQLSYPSFAIVTCNRMAPSLIRFHVFGRNLTYTSVSCAQISSELCHYCVSDGTHCSGDVCCAGLPGGDGHALPCADADPTQIKFGLSDFGCTGVPRA